MTSPSRELVQQVVAQVLEECAFLCTEQSAAPVTWPAQITRATLQFSGPRSGRIELSATRELTLAIAADMLGVDLEDPDVGKLADGALAELTNVVTGALMAKLFGTECLCELGMPVVEHGAPSERLLATTELTLVDMEGRPIDVRVSLRPPA